MSSPRSTLLQKAKETTTSPGVYLMKSIDGVVLYVGKAKNLKNRVSNYFQSGPHDVFRIEALVQRIQDFEVILTETESEALILENTLIKKYKPKFNVRLKDDKAYPYIKLSFDQKYPRVQYTRKVLKDGARYFGPFPNSRSARFVAELLQERFKLRDCSDNTFRHRSRPCILYQMEKCTAPCVGLISEADYRKDLDAVIRVLEGQAEPILTPLRDEMKSAAENEDFEYAALLRDQIQAIELVVQTQSVSDIHGRNTFDVVAIARENTAAQFSLIQVRKSKVIAIRHYQLTNVDPSLGESEIFQTALEQFYLLSPDERDEVTQTDHAVLCRLSDRGEIQDTAKNLKLTLLKAETPQDEQLLKVAQTNADYALKEAVKRATHHGIEALEDVQKTLGLLELPHRIECFDISNFQGTGSVASRVVFIDGEPDKNLYRRYKIQTVDGQNDFAMMKEVLGRRFKNDESLPDLVVVDGGKGQLSQAEAILEELSVQGVSVVGLAKARTESDFQAKEVGSSSERIFIPGRKNPILLKPHTAAFRLLTHIRDEAHRFAISYQRSLRGKN